MKVPAVFLNFLKQKNIADADSVGLLAAKEELLEEHVIKMLAAADVKITDITEKCHRKTMGGLPGEDVWRQPSC